MRLKVKYRKNKFFYSVFKKVYWFFYSDLIKYKINYAFRQIFNYSKFLIISLFEYIFLLFDVCKSAFLKLYFFIKNKHWIRIYYRIVLNKTILSNIRFHQIRELLDYWVHKLKYIILKNIFYKNINFIFNSFYKINSSKFIYSFLVSLILHLVIFFFIFFVTYTNYSYKNVLNSDFVIVDNIKIAEVSDYKTEKTSDKNQNYSDTKQHILENKSAIPETENKNSLIIKSNQQKKSIKRKEDFSLRMKKLGSKDTNNITPLRKPTNIHNKRLSSALLSIDSKRKFTLDKGEDQKGLLGRKNQDVMKNKTDEKIMTASIIDSIKGQFSACWTLPAGALNGENMVVILLLELDKKGNVISVIQKNKLKYNRDSLYRAFVDSAIRAVYRCSPIQGLEKIPYSEWSKIEMVFDPTLMF